MKTHHQRNGARSQATTALTCALIIAFVALGVGSLMAKPRPPGPPWVEATLFSEGFDQPYDMPANPAVDLTVWAESWSGYCLDRSTSPVVPWVIPMVVTNRLQMDPTSGAIRFWYRPGFDSGSGPGTIATLLTLASGSGSTSAVWWSLAVSQDGTTVSLACQDGNELVPCLSTTVAFQAGNWYLIAVGYSETNTAIFINDAMAVSGGGLPAVPAQAVPSTSLIVGSGIGGQQVAAGQIDELFVFSGSRMFRRLTGSPFGLDPQNSIADYYNAYSPTAALGPVTPEEEAARRTQRLASRATRMDSSPPPVPGGGTGGGDPGGTFIQMGVWPYTDSDLWIEATGMTNGTGLFVVHSPAAEAANGVYDLFMTTNLNPNVPGLNLTNWVWLLRTDPGETNLTVSDLPGDQAWFRLARTNDADGDGMSDALEQLVTHTDPGTPNPNPLPLVLSQPLSQTVYGGDSVTFTAVVAGAQPLVYQWRFIDANGTTTNLSGADASSLTLNNVQWGVAGGYSVQVFNTLGSTVSSNAMLTVTNTSENALPLVGARQDYTFKGDTTYYVEGATDPVELYGTTKIEGGAVIKYSTNANAKIIVKGRLECETRPWRPAIFTSQDDDTVGWALSFSTGTPTNSYAAVALEMASSEDTVLKHVRISYAQTAVHYPGGTSREVLGTVRHAQILHCGAGFVSEGTTNQSCLLNLRNVLVRDVGQAIGGSHFRGWAERLTVDYCNVFASDDSSSALGFFVTNSVFGDVTSLGGGVGLDGSNNGFYQDHSPQFGADEFVDDQPPFAPTGGVDDQGNPFIYVANGQGACYLRDGSPFVGVGATNMDLSLKGDFGQMTTFVPPDVFFDDVNSSMTIGPIAIRDPLAANLGYHYPAVDHVLTLATVNNATLNIDQGTVLALAGFPYWGSWGLRLNPGGRLNVNGLPTNHVVFAHLEAVQESPVGELEPWGPMITWRELYLSSGPPTPFPEAKLHYTDFPTLSGGWNTHFDAISPYLSVSYSIIANLELDGCHLQGGSFFYDDGGPAGRTLNLHNTLFDRCAVLMYDSGGYEDYFKAPSYSAQVTAANNLFYQCFMEFSPVNGAGAGSSWTFIDNVFDNASFWSEYDLWFLNGPVGVNHHNAYVGMSGMPNGGGRLLPPAPTSTDPDLAVLKYERGPLGWFYLPSTATNLLARGSRPAGAAGEYHFTCLTNNQKEATGQVSIGPHYLALVSGGVPDSNGDGIPDFLADCNGNGVEETSEVPWQSPNAGVLAILAPASNSIVSGIVQLRVGLDTNAAGIESIYPLVDGYVPRGSVSVDHPAGSVAEIEIDTTCLEDGQHVVLIGANCGEADGGAQGRFSMPVTMISSNQTRHPKWQGRAEQLVRVNLEVSPSVTNYTVWFFNSGYPKASDPFAPWIRTLYVQGSPTNGAVSYSETPANLGFGDGSTDPTIYSLTELGDSSGGQSSSGGQGSMSIASPNTRQDLPWPADTGWWVAAYADDLTDFMVSAHTDPTGRSYAWTRDAIADQYSGVPNLFTQSGMELWLHGWQLDSGWWLCGDLSSQGEQHTQRVLPHPGQPELGQTWPLRMGERDGGYNPYPDNMPHHGRDFNTLLDELKNPAGRNFYGLSHGSPDSFFRFTTGGYEAALQHRYRCVFLDGCDSALGRLFRGFGATDDEVESPVYPPGDVGGCATDLNYYENVAGVRPGAFLGWKTKAVIGYWTRGVLVTDDRTGLPCNYMVYEAMGDWHGQFLFNWVFGEPLLQAINDANRLAMGSSSWPPVQSLFVTLVWPDGTTQQVNFDPHYCLRVYGYGNLHFNEYNHSTDWPPQ